MDFDSYKVQTPFPSTPLKPAMPIHPGGKVIDPEEYQKWYSDLYIPYLDLMEQRKTIVDGIRAEEQRLYEKFKADLFADLGISEHPKREALFSHAWSLGHSSGYYEVYSYAQDLVDLIE